MQFNILSVKNKVPVLLVLSSMLMVLSMRNKWHWFLLIPVFMCVLGLYFFNVMSFLPKVNYQLKETVIMFVILFISIAVIFLSVFLEPETETDTQLAIRGLAVFMLSFLSAYICFATTAQSALVQILFAMLALFSVILAVVYVLLENNAVRNAVYISFTGITTIFIFYYIMTMKFSMFRWRKTMPTQQNVSMGGFVFSQITDPNKKARRYETIGGLKT